MPLMAAVIVYSAALHDWQHGNWELDARVLSLVTTCFAESIAFKTPDARCDHSFVPGNSPTCCMQQHHRCGLAVERSPENMVGASFFTAVSLQSVTSPVACSGLWHQTSALARRPLPACISVRFLPSKSGPNLAADAAPVAGAAEVVSTLSTAWGNRLQSLTLDGLKLADSFFPAVLEQLPGLQSLILPTLY
jgi:hypothetical protein